MTVPDKFGTPIIKCPGYQYAVQEIVEFAQGCDRILLTTVRMSKSSILFLESSRPDLSENTLFGSCSVFGNLPVLEKSSAE